MIITELKPQKKNPSRFNLSTNGEFRAGISATTLAKFTLYEGKNISEKDLEELLFQELRQRFLERLVEYIVRSPRSIFQANTYLKRIQYKKKDVWYSSEIFIDFEHMFEEIISKLVEQKLLDDENYAMLFVESRIRTRPRGKRVLISELVSKGVNMDIAREVCDELVDDEYELLERVFRKHFKDERIEISNRKQMTYLSRKGFSYDLIKSFVQNESKE
ncbi:RecX family transcriptional regulator [bacterium]|nr:RecX family transcriptional regulator [bacterium]